MIRIVKGTFGYFDGRRVVPVTAADGPQSYDPELEARLVSEGVAEYVAHEADHRVTVTPHVEVSVEVEADQIPLGMKLLFDLLRNSFITAERLLITAERTVKLLEEQVHDGDNVCGILTRRQTLSETSCYNCFDHVLSGGAFHRRSG